MAKSNKGNKFPRTQLQIQTATRRMLLDNPMKKPRNQLMQSHRMTKNQLWRLRKRELIKQQPSAEMDNSKEKSEIHN